MRIRNLYAPKDIKLQPNVSVYEILTSNKLYDEVKETIYHLNIKYLPCEAILNKFAPNKQMSSKEKAFFLCELIKMCNPDSPNYNRELEEFLEDKPFIASCDAVMKALVANGLNDSMNVFIVLPNIVYKYLGLIIAKRIHELLNVDFFCVFIQEDLKENGFKMLKTLLEAVGGIKRVFIMP